MQQGLHERQFKDLYVEDDVPLSNVRPTAIRILLYTGLSTFVLLVLAGIFLRVPREVRIPFTLRSDSREVVYRFADNTQVLKMYVKPGHVVHEGDTLAKITSATVVSLLNQLATAQEALRLFESSDVAMNKNQKESLALQKSKVQSQINDAKKERALKTKKQTSELANLQEELDVASKHTAEMKKLQGQGFASDKELRDAQLKETNARDALTRSKQQYAIELGALDEKIRQLEIDQNVVGVNTNRSDLELGSKRAQLTSAVSTLEIKIRELYGRFASDNGSLYLLSSMSLPVSYAVDEEHELPSGNVLLKLSSTGTTLYALCSVAPQLIGSMQEGLDAVMKVSSFPSFHWGMAKGVVQHKSMSPDEKGNYPVEIRISDAGQLAPLLQVGMSGEADVLVENRPLASYVFESLSAPFRQ